jgi:hypothetical protein
MVSQLWFENVINFDLITALKASRWVIQLSQELDCPLIWHFFRILAFGTLRTLLYRAINGLGGRMRAPREACRPLRRVGAVLPTPS